MFITVFHDISSTYVDVLEILFNSPSTLKLFVRYHFKLDKHYVRGDNVSLHLVGAFASMNENDVSELHTLIRYMLKGNSSVIFGGGPHSDNQSMYYHSPKSKLLSKLINLITFYCF